MPTVCVYKGDKYYNPRCANDMIKISSANKKDNTFIEDKHLKKRFFKMVHRNELDAFYSIEYWVFYKGIKFECMGISKKALKSNRITILTNDLHIAELLKFSRFDKFTYELDISLEEVSALLVEKKDLIGIEKKIIERKQESIISYLKSYPDCL